MKRCIHFILITFIVISVASILILTIPQLKSSLLNPFQKTTLTAKSIRDIKTLDTSLIKSTSYHYKSIFPYDFIYGEPAWGNILIKNSKFLTDEDKLNKDFYNKCYDIGIDLNKLNYFFIIEVEATAGFDLEDYINSPFLSSNDQEKSIVLKKPYSNILSMDILDSLTNENYPNVELTPKEWRSLMELLLPIIEEKIENTGLLKVSQESNEKILTQIFSSLGWETIEFK